MISYYRIGVSKKTKKPRKPEKKTKKTEPKKNWLNRLKFWKNRSVLFSFGFISKKPEKPNRIETEKTGKNRAKPENWAKPIKPSQNQKNEPNQFEPVLSLKNWTEPNRNWSVWPGFGFFQKNFGLVTFFDKNRTEQKMTTPTIKAIENSQVYNKADSWQR
jgi:hypothetical protein